MPDKPIIECENLVKIYKTKDIEVLALQGLELTIDEGELMAIIGNSGSGKSTFLNMIGGLDRPSAGRLIVDGKDLFKLGEKELVEYKKKTVELLELVGLSARKHSRLSQLSGGEQQRVAIAIALANRPRILLADEPTGSVDAKTAAYILDVFREINKSLGTTIVIVTHDRLLSKKVNRVVAIRDGKISSERIMKQSYLERLSDITTLAEEEQTQDEFAILDKAGRLQIPRELLEQMAIKDNKVRLTMQDGRIIIENPTGGAG